MRNTPSQTGTEGAPASSKNTADMQWQSLSPWAMMSFIFNTLRLLVTNAYAVLPFVYTGWNKGFDSPWIIGGLLLALIGIMLFSFGSWFKFRYRIQEHQLDIRRGIIFKKADEIPFNKIQNVRLQQAFYLRPLKLYSLVVETAGSKKDEAELSAINYRQAMKLKRQLLKERDTANHSPSPLQAEEKVETSQIADNTHKTSLLVNRSIKQLALFGFYQNNAIWLAVILGPILGQFEWDNLFEHELINSSILWYQAKTHDNQLIQLGVVVIALLFIYLIFSLISIASAILKYHPYSLSLIRNTLHRTGGLIAKQNDALKLRRIQVIGFSQPLIARLLKLWTVSFKQVQGNEVENRGQHMLIPSMSRQEISTLLPALTDLASHSTVIPSHFIGIHSIWLWRRVSLTFVIGLICTLIFQDVLLSPLLLIGTLAIISGIYLRFRQWGYALEEEDIWVHSGFMGHTWHCIPISKVQHVALVQTQGQKKRAVANIELGIASGQIVIPCINETIASQLSERILRVIASDNHNWI